MNYWLLLIDNANVAHYLHAVINSLFEVFQFYERKNEQKQIKLKQSTENKCSGLFNNQTRSAIYWRYMKFCDQSNCCTALHFLILFAHLEGIMISNLLIYSNVFLFSLRQNIKTTPSGYSALMAATVSCR